MPTFTPYTKNHLDQALTVIGKAIYTPVAPLEIQAWCSHEPIPFVLRATGPSQKFKVGDKWGNLFDCAWFRFSGKVPPSARGKPVVLLLDVNGEMCIFDPNGVPLRGLTNVSSGYDYSLGRPGKHVYPITENAAGGEEIEVWADAGCNDLFGELREDGVIREAIIATTNETVRHLYYDFEVLLDFLKVLPENSVRYQQILVALSDVSHMLYQGVAEVAADARARLHPLLAKKGGDPSLRISAVGHAHMDLAWLWPMRETIRKGARTFSTAIAHIEKYPAYVFGASQPQYFQWMKEYYPALYEIIKAKVAEGRIEPQGAMWVEADTNISGGEALVRQILQGRRFFRQEFGVDVRYLWLPDVFGYNGNLPQILKKAGVEIFATQKLSWSLINRFPHHSFKWQGIDGSTILAHMFPEDTYNSPALPHSVRKIEQNYRDSGISQHALMVFGIGDGGGGPGEEHLERLERIHNLEGLSPVKQESAAAFFQQWRNEADRFATWVGELYLERHQGTLTTEARNKWFNRKIELGLRELEWSCVLGRLLTAQGATLALYPAERLQAMWRETLLYQFHDILPGSSIKRVYDECLARYEDIRNEILGRLGDNDRRLARRIGSSGMLIPLLVQNSLSWERTEWIQAGDRWLCATIPAMGYTVVDLATVLPPQGLPLSASSTLLENDLLRVTFAADGSITSIVDKRCEREIIPPGERANQLAVYTDLGDAWDFAMDYAEQTPRRFQVVSIDPRIEGPRAILEITYHLGHSEIVQEVSLTQGSARLDFVTRVRWREPQTMLRTSFPVNIQSDEASFEIQFGHIRRPTHRNTTWALALDEVAAHKWVDLSQRDYGVALLNDSKYGHKVKGHVLDLNLLRSVPYPGPRLVQDADVRPGEPHHAYTDQCDHQFTYALYPHPGDVVKGGVVRAAYELNVPLRMMPLAPQAGDLPLQDSYLSLENVSSPEPTSIIIEAVKQAEDLTDPSCHEIIVRLYESARQATSVALHCGFEVIRAEEVDLMEEHPTPLKVAGNAIRLDFQPFEIKTLKVYAHGTV